MNRKNPDGPIAPIIQPVMIGPGNRAQPVDEHQPGRGGGHVGLVQIIVHIGQKQRIERVRHPAPDRPDQHQQRERQVEQPPASSAPPRQRPPATAPPCGGPSGPTASRSDIAAPARRYRSTATKIVRSLDRQTRLRCPRPTPSRTVPKRCRPAGTCPTQPKRRSLDKAAGSSAVWSIRRPAPG